jgi:hypothetical protein
MAASAGAWDQWAASELQHRCGGCVFDRLALGGTAVDIAY